MCWFVFEAKRWCGVCVCVFVLSATDSDVPSLFSQKSRESHTGLATSAGHHLHALLCESGGGRHLTNCFHLFQLLFAVFPGENKDNDARVTLANALKKATTHTHSESCRLLMRVIAELQHFFQVMGPLIGRWCEVASQLCSHTICPSCLLGAPSWQDYQGHVGMIAPLWSFHLLHLYGRSGRKNGDFKQSVFNIKNYIWHDKMCSQKRLISLVISNDCNMWTLWCLIKMP